MAGEGPLTLPLLILSLIKGFPGCPPPPSSREHPPSGLTSWARNSEQCTNSVVLARIPLRLYRNYYVWGRARVHVWAGCVTLHVCVWYPGICVLVCERMCVCVYVIASVCVCMCVRTYERACTCLCVGEVVIAIFFFSNGQSYTHSGLFQVSYRIWHRPEICHVPYVHTDSTSFISFHVSFHFTCHYISHPIPFHISFNFKFYFIFIFHAILCFFQFHISSYFIFR